MFYNLWWNHENEEQNVMPFIIQNGQIYYSS
jgi:hypothetical protein